MRYFINENRSDLADVNIGELLGISEIHPGDLAEDVFINKGGTDAYRTEEITGPDLVASGLR